MKKPRKKKDGSVEVPSTCNLCGSKDNLETNSVSGKFHCWNCGYSGVRKGHVPPTVVTGKEGFPSLNATGTPTRPGRRGIIRGNPGAKSTGIPPWVLKKISRRRLDQARLEKYGVSFDGSRLIWPVEGGQPWERAVFEWDTPKVRSYGQKGILGLHLVRPGSHVVLTEGDFKAASIPSPWVGVAIGGKIMTPYQEILLLSRQPASVTVLLDTGPACDAAGRAVLRSLRRLGIQVHLGDLNAAAARISGSRGYPDGTGPDDVPISVRICALLDAQA